MALASHFGIRPRPDQVSPVEGSRYFGATLRVVPSAPAGAGADFDGRPGFITVHPSYLLRMPDRDAREKAYGDFVRDLRNIRKLAGTSA